MNQTSGHKASRVEIPVGRAHVLALNGDSSSIKFAVYGLGEISERGLHGHLDRIGLPGTRLTFQAAGGDAPPASCPIAAADQPTAINYLLHWLVMQPDFANIRAVGHRMVHGLEHH